MRKIKILDGLIVLVVIALIGNYLKKMTRVKNNNPFNLRNSDRYAWQGEIGTDYQGFVIFDTLDNGVRAGIKNLINGYFSKGLTIRQMITKYAPPTENNTENYIKYVAKPFGKDSHVPLSVQDKKTVVERILKMEGEGYPVTEQMILKHLT